MKKAALIYNPLSGGRRARRLADVERAAAALHAEGVQATLSASRAPGAAAEQAREAAEHGCDAVLACGGDGTVNEVLQGLIGSQAALGVIPLGTGNILAYALRIPRDPAAAARVQARAQARRVAAGVIESHDPEGAPRSRYFAFAAGIGVDAQLPYRATVAAKGRLGMAAYVAHLARIYFTHRFAPFEAAWNDETGAERRAIVSEVLAVRVADLGWMLPRAIPGAGLERDDLRLALFATPSRIAYLSFLLGIWTRRGWPVRGIEFAYARELTCRPVAEAPHPWRVRTQDRIYAEVDGELVGTLPVRVRVVPGAFQLLVPSGEWRVEV